MKTYRGPHDLNTGASVEQHSKVHLGPQGLMAGRPAQEQSLYTQQWGSLHAGLKVDRL